MHRFKDLEIWKQSRAFCKDIYEITSVFLEAEKFGLISQLRRASVSVPSNIAEGASQNSNKDFGRFLEIAIGSCYEIETQLLIANDLGFIKGESLNPVLLKLEAIIKMTSKFKSTLK
ncbi:four helix bundle protein [Aequorivita echinoideorum]|uniref:Four helix bundle protein n=1 Tax=Aequorivita echinoideorum TaxID=1549647 RepID=A0ABS5S5P8_9FLAO|nr:four helix bundle protein [Aequorivita echinoideorum]MBT0608537.1 four helix bundle protein [Aequorivita echinoideorum]